MLAESGRTRWAGTTFRRYHFVCFTFLGRIRAQLDMLSSNITSVYHRAPRALRRRCLGDQISPCPSRLAWRQPQPVPRWNGNPGGFPFRLSNGLRATRSDAYWTKGIFCLSLLALFTGVLHRSAFSVHANLHNAHQTPKVLVSQVARPVPTHERSCHAERLGWQRSIPTQSARDRKHGEGRHVSILWAHPARRRGSHQGGLSRRDRPLCCPQRLAFFLPTSCLLCGSACGLPSHWCSRVQ